MPKWIIRLKHFLLKLTNQVIRIKQFNNIISIIFFLQTDSFFSQNRPSRPQQKNLIFPFMPNSFVLLPRPIVPQMCYFLNLEKFTSSQPLTRHLPANLLFGLKTQITKSSGYLLPSVLLSSGPMEVFPTLPPPSTAAALSLSQSAFSPSSCHSHHKILFMYLSP